MRESLPSFLRLRVITEARLLVDEEVDSVMLPSLEGYLGILPGHRPLLVALGEGFLTFQVQKKEKKYHVEGGYAEITADKVLVYTKLIEDGDSEKIKEKG